MTIKTIAVGLNGTSRDTPTLETAFQLARKFQAHVDVVFAYPRAVDLVPMTGEGVSASVVDQLVQSARKEIDERSAAAQAVFRDAVAKGDIKDHDTPPGPQEPSASWRVEQGRAEDVLTQAGRLNDLIVVDRFGDDDHAVQGALILEETLMNSGRPLFLHPRKPVEMFGRSIAIAWSPTPQATHAVVGAMPFLRTAETVHVLTAATRKTAADTADSLVDYLGWHGVEATPSRVEPGVLSVGAALLDQAGAIGADMLVMGGYGHSRWRQMILGGVTRDVLAESRIPVLMAH